MSNQPFIENVASEALLVNLRRAGLVLLNVADPLGFALITVAGAAMASAPPARRRLTARPLAGSAEPRSRQ